VNLLILAALVAGAAAIGVALMYLVRRTAKADVFLTETAPAFFDPAQRGELQGELACYARAVVHQEWPAMDDEERSAAVDHWRLEMEDTVRSLDLRTQRERAGFAQVLRERDARADNRRLRLEEARPVVSLPVWVILAFGGLPTAAFVLIFTDRRESFVVQGAMIGVVAGMVAASLLLVWFLDHPFEGQSGRIAPTEMERTITRMKGELPASAAPCASTGDPRPS
jgi:hypothetical protein